MNKKGAKMQTTGHKKDTVYKVRIVEDDTYSSKNVRNHIITLIIGTGLFFFFNITNGLIEKVNNKYKVTDENLFILDYVLDKLLF